MQQYEMQPDAVRQHVTTELISRKVEPNKQSPLKTNFIHQTDVTKLSKILENTCKFKKPLFTSGLFPFFTP